MPIGPPKILRNLPVDQMELDKPGLHMVAVLPPRQEANPVLPLRTKKGRLVFALCAGTMYSRVHSKAILFLECADREQQCFCTCADIDRTIVGAYTAIELRKAIENGYIITSLLPFNSVSTSKLLFSLACFESWIYSEGTNDLFKAMVNKFFALKSTASGLPKHLQTENEKQAYVDLLNSKLGSNLSIQDFKFNPGLRLISKISINSIWGTKQFYLIHMQNA